MLIPCPECQHNVSDKAVSCPMCGYPINAAPARPVAPHTPSKRNRKYKRLPNGIGSIQRLSGKRAKPFAAYPPIREYHLNGSPVRQPAIGYYEEWHQAYSALQEYNKNPSENVNLTFADVYKLYFEDKYIHSKKKLSASSKRSTGSAYNNCATLHNKIFASLVAKDLQAVIDNCTLKHSSLELILSLFKGMYKYARMNNLIGEDYSQYVTINIPDDDESGEPFTQHDLDILWGNKSNPIVQMILIMIYTGYRISAFETISVHDNYFRGGVKTKAGKNRIVPIHPSIHDFVFSSECLLHNFDADYFRVHRFYPVLQELGISHTSSGKLHTPHDCRHTFSWLCDRYNVDEVSKHLLMGHSLGTDVERSVYAHRTVEELRNEINKIKVDLL